MKLWLDDVRKPPDDSWVWCKSYKEFCRALGWASSAFEVISLDHDLGDEKTKTGHDCLIFLEENFHHGIHMADKVFCHSMNPEGRKKIEAGIRRLHEKGYLK